MVAVDQEAAADPTLRWAAEVARLHARLDEVIARLERIERERGPDASDIEESLTYLQAELEKVRRQLASGTRTRVVLDPEQREAIADAVLERLNPAFELTAEIDPG